MNCTDSDLIGQNKKLILISTDTIIKRKGLTYLTGSKWPITDGQEI